MANVIRTKLNSGLRDLRSVHNLLDRHQLPGTDFISSAIAQAEQFTTANEEDTILGFSGAHAQLKDALSRAADLNKSIAEPQLLILKRARTAIANHWPFLSTEADTTDQDRQAADELVDSLKKETFFKQLPSIDQQSNRIVSLYQAAFHDSVQKRAGVYLGALDQLSATVGWDQLDEQRQALIAEPLAKLSKNEAPDNTPIPQIRSDIDAAGQRLANSIAEVHRLVEGDRIVRVKLASHFATGIDNTEQLDQALDSLRTECLHHIGKNKHILIQ